MKLNKYEELLFDLIFSDKTEYNINIGEYINDIYNYNMFVTEVRRVLKRSKVSVIESTINLDNKAAIWRLKVNR